MKKICLFFMLIFSIGAFSQSTLAPTDSTSKKDKKYSPELIKKEIEIKALFDKILKQDTHDSARIAINEEIKVKLGEALKIKGSFSYPFDSLKNLGKIYSDDYGVRVFSWSCEMENLSYKFWGFIQDFENDAIYPLVQSAPTYLPEEGKEILLTRWYGALYYKAIKVSKKGRDPKYILLGWTQPNTNTKAKIMEVLSITDEKVMLGSKIFKGYKGKSYRVVFSYCSDMAISLTYDEIQKRFVFDHLTPLSDDRGNSRGCNGPDMSYDSLKQKGKRWVLKKDVDVRNDK